MEKKKDGKRTQVTVKMPRDLYKGARIRALEEDISVANLMEKAVTAYLRKRTRATATQ